MELVTRMQRRYSIPLQLILGAIGTIYHKRSIRGAQILDEPAVLFAAPDACMLGRNIGIDIGDVAVAQRKGADRHAPPIGSTQYGALHT